MKTQHKVMVLALLAGIFFWVLDATFCFLFLHEGAFLDLLILKVSSHNLFTRLLAFAVAIVFAIVGLSLEAGRKRAEQDLRESEEKYRAVFEQAADAIVLVDIQTRSLLKFNSKTHKNLGYSREEFQKLKIEDFEAVESAEEVAEHLRKVTTKGTDSFATKHRTKDGRIRDILTSCQAISIRGRILSVAIWRDITERKRAEEALRRERDYVGSIIETAQAIILVLDLQGRIVSFNPYMEKLSGYRLEEVKGKDWFSTFLPERDGEKIRSVFQNAVQNIQTRGNVNPIVSRDGREIEIEWYDKTLRDANGHVSGVLSIGQDITDRKQAEAALRESEGKLDAMLQSIPDHMSMMDEDLNILWANGVAKGLFGDNIIGKKCYEVYHGRNKPCEPFPCLTLKTFQDGQVHEHETLVQTRAGKTLYYACTASVALRDDEGRPAAVIEISRDITEQKKVQEELRESEQKYREMIESLSEAVYRMSLPEGTYEYFSPSAKFVFGYSAEQFLNNPLLIKKIISPDFTDYFTEQWSDLLKGKVPPTYEYRITDPDGNERWIMQSSKGSFDAEGNIIAIEGICRNITQRKQTEERLQDYQEQLRGLASELALAEDHLRRNIGTDLHDGIGQGLALVKMQLDALRSKSNRGRNTAETLGQIAKSVEKMVQQVRTLIFDLSPPVLYELGLEPAVEWLIDSTRSSHGMEVSFEDDGQDKPLDDDLRTGLFRAVRELLTNAAKHAQAKSVKVHTRKEGTNIKVQVEDDGVGFDVSQVISRRGVKVGFGLVSIRERLRCFGGSFELDSEPGKGTRATLVAPLKTVS